MGKSFWDNPFGGLFDLNKDGCESFGERWLAYKIIEESTRPHKAKDDDDWGGYRRKHYAYVSDDQDAQEDEDVEDEWRLYCEDGSDVDVDPWDYESEEEYEEALSEAREQQAVTITVQIEVPGTEALNAINPADYPNRRKYEAAFYLWDLQQGTAYIPEDTSAEAEIERCRFILRSDTLAAQYLTVFKDFLYAQAIKDHFTLPIDIPDEDSVPETWFPDLLQDVAEEDPELAVKIWDWCIKQFGPFGQYMENPQLLYNYTMCSLNQYPDEFLDIAASAIGADPEFRDGLLTKGAEFPHCCSPVITRALMNGMGQEASLMFTAAILNPAGSGRDMEELIQQIISDCSDWEEVETMERFQQYLLPVIQKINNNRIRSLYPKFVQRAADYISYVESTGERYRCSRKHAWRNNCQDGAQYGIDPLDYETEEEYNQAIQEEKYAWRSWAAVDGKKLGVDPADFETEDEFHAVYNQAWKEDLRKHRETAAKLVGFEGSATVEQLENGAVVESATEDSAV